MDGQIDSETERCFAGPLRLAYPRWGCRLTSWESKLVAAVARKIGLGVPQHQACCQRQPRPASSMAWPNSAFASGRGIALIAAFLASVLGSSEFKAGLPPLSSSSTDSASKSSRVFTRSFELPVVCRMASSADPPVFVTFRTGCSDSSRCSPGDDEDFVTATAALATFVLSGTVAPSTWYFALIFLNNLANIRVGSRHTAGVRDDTMPVPLPLPLSVSSACRTRTSQSALSHRRWGGDALLPRASRDPYLHLHDERSTVTRQKVEHPGSTKALSTPPPLPSPPHPTISSTTTSPLFTTTNVLRQPQVKTASTNNVAAVSHPDRWTVPRPGHCIHFYHFCWLGRLRLLLTRVPRCTAVHGVHQENA